MAELWKFGKHLGARKQFGWLWRPDWKSWCWNGNKNSRYCWHVILFSASVFYIVLKCALHLIYPIGTKKVGAEVKFLLDYKDFWPINQISYADAVEKFPHLLKKFYENHLEMIDDPHATGVGFAVAETQNTVGDPMRVTCNLSLLLELFVRFFFVFIRQFLNYIFVV